MGFKAESLSGRVPKAAEVAELLGGIPDRQTVRVSLLVTLAEVETAADIMGDSKFFKFEFWLVALQSRLTTVLSGLTTVRALLGGRAGPGGGWCGEVVGSLGSFQ